MSRQGKRTRQLLWALLIATSISRTHAQSSSSAASVTTAETLAQEWFTDNFDENETQLAVGVNSALKNLTDSDVICYGVPSVQRRTNEESPNGGCPEIYTAVNASCSCLTSGYSDTGTWEFHVAFRTDEGSEKYPAELTSSDILAIDSIRTLLVPSTLTTLRLVGEGTYPQTITFVPQDQGLPGSTLPIAQVEDGSIGITTVSLENIDMSSITQSVSTFYPSSTTNVTLRNCNMIKFGYDFFEGVDNVRYLDMSSNHLTAAYVGSSIAHTCSNQFCAVEVLNLTNNSISTFPTVVFNVDNLQELYIADNDITDFNISSTVFSAIQALVAFDSDLPDEASTCTHGTWQTAHNRKFCVTNGSIAANMTSSDSNSLTIGLVAGGCAIVIIAVALVAWWYLSHKKAHRMSSSKDDFYSQDFGDTLDFDDTQVQVDPVFLNDPVIVTNRLDHKLLKMGRCISKGGFGLVFMGEYKGRRVAIKKIRPDRSVTTAEIETFLKEIIMMAVLYHPRIVEFIGVAWDNLRNLSAVTEFMDNGDLREVLHGYKLKGERLSWESHKATIALHIAEALSYLHALKPKIIHRDLKSKNVLLNMYLEAKLSDFGISRMRYLVETHMTAGVGTSFWIAPEVLLGRDYDEAADIFSFGVVLSEIDTDDYPYWNDENPSNHGKIQEAEILSLVAEGKLRPSFSNDCPKAIVDLADCCLQKNPEDRPTAAEIVVILEHMIHASERSSSSLHSGAWSVTSSNMGN
ncbi:TKL protein kinase [Phytophthora nicotianae P1976]|uniref:TKL protein kinase n=1 Tax=Phytophthora nicotianae P1976 TaxID=1317066 RepID=A0A081B5F0_PHYNI|nr:TKL protein kinase [Phytophthora nicotianae P1976]